jgi:hypothetical protein
MNVMQIIQPAVTCVSIYQLELLAPNCLHATQGRTQAIPNMATLKSVGYVRYSIAFNLQVSFSVNYPANNA